LIYIYINTRSLKRDRAIKKDPNYVEQDPFGFDENDALGLEDDLAFASILEREGGPWRREQTRRFWASFLDLSRAISSVLGCLTSHLYQVILQLDSDLIILFTTPKSPIRILEGLKYNI
jgi:hypothetical protein